MTKAVLVLALLLLVASCTPATGPTTRPSATDNGSGQVELQSMVGQRVTLTGIFWRSKSGAAWITLNANDSVSFEGKTSGLKPRDGQRIKVTGILQFEPGFDTEPQWGRGKTVPAHYFFESAEISAAPDAGAATHP